VKLCAIPSVPVLVRQSAELAVKTEPSNQTACEALLKDINTVELAVFSCEDSNLRTGTETKPC
jgi:hypothetical protein